MSESQYGGNLCHDKNLSILLFHKKTTIELDHSLLFVYCLFKVSFYFLPWYSKSPWNHHLGNIVYPSTFLLNSRKKNQPPPTRHFWCRKEEDAMRWVGPQAETGGWDSWLWGMFKIPPFPETKCVYHAVLSFFVFQRELVTAVFVVEEFLNSKVKV